MITIIPFFKLVVFPVDIVNVSVLVDPVTFLTNPRWSINFNVCVPPPVVFLSNIINWLIIISITRVLSGILFPKT